MSLRADTSPLISGCLLASLYPGHGVRGDAIPATGTHGAAPLYAWLSLPTDAANEYRWQVTTPPSVGDLVVFEDGSYSYTPPPATVDLLETFDFDAWENGASLGSATYTITIGSPGGSVIAAAAGVGTASSMAGASAAAAAITQAAGVATCSTLTGVAGSGSVMTAAAGAATTETMAGASAAAAGITAAAGVASASSMAGAAAAASAISAAAGVATAATLGGSTAGASSAISPAAGASSAQILVGAAFARAAIGAAAGFASATTMTGGGGLVVLSAPPTGHGPAMSARTTSAGRSRPAQLNSRTR